MIKNILKFLNTSCFVIYLNLFICYIFYSFIYTELINYIYFLKIYILINVIFLPIFSIINIYLYHKNLILIILFLIGMIVYGIYILIILDKILIIDNNTKTYLQIFFYLSILHAIIYLYNIFYIYFSI